MTTAHGHGGLEDRIDELTSEEYLGQLIRDEAGIADRIKSGYTVSTKPIADALLTTEVAKIVKLSGLTTEVEQEDQFYEDILSNVIFQRNEKGYKELLTAIKNQDLGAIMSGLQRGNAMYKRGIRFKKLATELKTADDGILTHGAKYLIKHGLPDEDLMYATNLIRENPLKALYDIAQIRELTSTYAKPTAHGGHAAHP